jgi:Na+-translocating ferredoxin:NAD+ oxidoreductase subunit D
MTTERIMHMVLLALLPGAIVQIGFFGFGYVWTLGIAVATAMALERSVSWLRARDHGAWRDGSALVTAALIALALPPTVPPSIVLIAVAGGLLLGKHVYGGLGGNPFNPAMVGYALVLVSFPRELAAWPVPSGVPALDAVVGATPLERFMHRGGLTVDDVWHASAGFGQVAGFGWEWINLAYLVGGVWLIARRIADWRIPVALLVSLGSLAALTYDGGSSASLGSPSFHWFSGGTMLAAFFVATDPVSSPTSRRGRILFGILIGALVFLVRALGAYPDGVAFAILLGNAAAPMLDQLSRRSIPRAG